MLAVFLACSSGREHELVEEIGWKPAQVRRNVRQMAEEGFLTISRAT